MSSTAVSRPEFSQRAAPRPGQHEIELLAGIGGRLTISEGCLGITAPLGGSETFVTVVWPWNARLERTGSGWRVVNTQTMRAVEMGGILTGGGGFAPDFTPADLRDYNQYLTRDLSAHCAAKGSFALNRDFRPG